MARPSTLADQISLEPGAGLTAVPSTRLLLRRWWPVALLCLLYVVSLIDRLLLTILIQPLKHDLGLADTQIALLVGSSFALFYSAIGLPVAWALDRGRRLQIGIIGIVLWSASTFASGFANSFDLLLALRIGVAIGEAILAPLGISLIADLFPRHARSLPLSIFIAAGLLGIFSAYALGGWIVALIEQGVFAHAPVIGGLAAWRAALVLTSLPGFLIAALLWFTVPDPERVDDYSLGEESRRTRVGAFLHKSDALRFYLLFFLGVGVASMPSYAALAWFPTYLVRAFEVGLPESGYVFSLSLIAATVILLSIPVLMRFFARRGRTASLVPIALVILPVGMALFGLSLTQGSLAKTVPFMILGYGLLAGGINTLPQVAVGLTAPAPFRGRIVAIGLASINLIGLGIGPYLTAWIAEKFFHGPRALGDALLCLTFLVTPLAWGLIYMSWAPFHRALQFNPYRVTDHA